MYSRFTHVVACVRITFLSKAEKYSIVCVDHILSIHLFVDGHLGCLYLLTIMNNAAMNMVVQISIRVPAFNIFGHLPRSELSGRADS